MNPDNDKRSKKLPKKEDLFFELTISPFKSISIKGNVVITDNRKVISNETVEPPVFLGVRPCIIYNDKGDKDIFLTTHKQAYTLAKALYQSITGVAANHDYYNHNESLNHAFFLVSNNTSDVSIADIDTENPEKQNVLAFIEKGAKKSSTKESQKPFNPLSDFELIIGVQNYYDGNDEITFYFIVSHKGYSKGSYLTVGSFKFSEEIKKRFIRSEWDINILTREIQSVATSKAISEIGSFKGMYTRFFEEKWIGLKTELIPVCLDVLDYNREVQSVKVDRKLVKEIKNARESVIAFRGEVSKSRADFAMLIDFVIYNNHFDLYDDSMSLQKVEQICVQKKSYSVIFNRVLNVFNKADKKALSEYLKGQCDSYELIREYLR